MAQRELYSIPSLNERYYPNRYAIDKKGTLFRYEKTPGKYSMKPVKIKRIRTKNTKREFQKVLLEKKDIHYVHKLLAEVFLEPIEGINRLTFKNKKHKDLSLENLMWWGTKEGETKLRTDIKPDYIRKNTNYKRKPWSPNPAIRQRELKKVMNKRIYDKILPLLNFERKGSLVIYEILTYGKAYKQIGIEEGVPGNSINSRVIKECKKLGIDYELIKQYVGRGEYKHKEKDVTFNESL